MGPGFEPKLFTALVRGPACRDLSARASVAPALRTAMGGLPGMHRDRAVWCRWEVFWHFILVWQLTLVWPELGYRTVQLRQAGALGLEINMTSGARPLFWAGVTNHLLTDSLGSTAPCPPTAPLTTVAAMSGDFESKPDVDSATVPNMPCASCSCFNSWGSFSPRASWPSCPQIICD